MIFTSLDDIPNDRVCRALTGLSKEDFAVLCKAFAETFATIRQEAYQEGLRKRRPGAGRKGYLDSPEKPLFFLLYYLKNYPTFDVLGYLFDLDAGHACDHVHRLAPVLEKTLDALKQLPARLLETVADLKQAVDKKAKIIIDAAERAGVRPTDPEQQKARYSGKKNALR
jgi:hypothetical protein